MADIPLMNNPMTTAGDLIRGGASGAPTRLPIGSNGDVLQVVAGALAFAPVSAAVPGNGWSMTKTASQTLTSNTLTQVTFDANGVNGGGSVIDLANERFVIPATGIYQWMATWLWETTAPATTAHISVKVGATEASTLSRVPGTPAANGGLTGHGLLALTSGDFLTLWIHPGGAVTPTVRGNASVHLASQFMLVRIT